MLIKKKSPHGGDIYTNRVRLDFSANINPAGMPERVRQALMEAVGNCSAYPDPYCTALRKKLAAAERVPENCILCGNGAAELIYQYAYALPQDQPALIVSPAFCEYGQALHAAKIAVESYILTDTNGFRLTEDILRTDLSRYSAIFLASPNNPTGISIAPKLICAIAAAGIAALECTDWLRDSVQRISAERERMTAELGVLGLRVYPGEANYLLLYSEKQLAEPLMRRGVMVRVCSDYTGLNDRYFRIAIRTKEENDRLLSELKEVMK